MMTAVVFDIDGVLVKGKQAIPGAAEALQRLFSSSPRIPYVFVTNDGGKLEREKSALLANILNVDPQLCPETAILMSSTPLAGLSKTLGKRRVLAVGAQGAEATHTLLRTYGFDQVVAAEDVLAAHPSMVPLQSVGRVSGCSPTLDLAGPFEAIFVLHDPVDWTVNLQLMLDVLLSCDGTVHGPRGPRDGGQIPVFIANPDFEYRHVWRNPRLTCGAFTACLKALYAEARGEELLTTVFGKPNTETFEYAVEMLGGKEKQWDNIFMIGDNPKSDIAGALAMGRPWVSVLVLTGNATENDPERPADLVFDNVAAAIDHILETATDTHPQQEND